MMSYHDGYDPRRENTAMVNPLLRIEQKFDKIKKLLVDLENEIGGVSGADLKTLIQEILDE
tara:strand:- start:377 stop:559 length:183 start_codon:yes stop_codon:yes gene_type:complete